MQWNNRIFVALKEHLYFHEFIFELRVVVSCSVFAIVAYFSWLCLANMMLCRSYRCYFCWWWCCYFLLILNGFYYACSFGCHENFKIFVCIIICMITYFHLFSVGFVVVVVNNWNQPANIMIWRCALCWWNGRNETQFNI